MLPIDTFISREKKIGEPQRFSIDSFHLTTFFYISVIMLMTGSSFLLTPTSGEKLLINSIAILSAILYLIYFALTLPFTRDDIPIIGK